MPTKYAMQPQWRQRREAIAKKGGLEAEMLLEAEPMFHKSKPDAQDMGSPVSVSFIFDALPEIQHIVLPGAWTTVGKGGRPLRGEQKMYDPPQQKKRTRRRKVKDEEGDDASSLADYEEMPSSSNCLIALSRSILQHEKAVERKQQAKHWAKYRQQKVMHALARDELVAALTAEGLFDDDDGTQSLNASQVGPRIKTPWQLKNAPRNKRAKTTRRNVRLAAAAARCYFAPDDDVPTDVVPDGEVPVRTTKFAAASPALLPSANRAESKEEGRVDVKISKSGKNKRRSKNCCVM